LARRLTTAEVGGIAERPAVERVLQIHTRYREPGGEERVVEAERRLLEGAGLSVRQVIFDNAELREARSLAGDLRIAGSAIWSRSAQRRVGALVDAFGPQVVHVHNTFAAASPSIYRAVGGTPVVQTLHNYRFVCPAATAFRDGHACTDCVGRPIPWPAVLHACVRGSRAQSAVAATTLALHRAVGTFEHGIAAYVALTSFQRQVMVDGGLPADRIRVIANFHEPDPGVGRGPRDGVLYVGRLTAEKGLGPLIRAAAQQPRIVRVAGAGPLVDPVERSAAAGHIGYLGTLEASAVLAELRGAVALVLPSVWFEGFPLVILEAYATGTPVIASRIGSLAELVEDSVTGLLVRPDDEDELAERLRWAVDHPAEMAEMGARARQRYETAYRAPAHLAALLDTYRELVAAPSGP